MSRAVELCRFPAVDASEETVPLDGLASLAVLNGLAAQVFIRWSNAESDPDDPTFFVWDWACPGESLSIVPIPVDARRAKLKVIYPAAPPVTDVRCVVMGSECTWAPQVGPLA